MTTLFKSELTIQAKEVLEDSRVQSIKEAAEKYFGVNHTVNGKEFFEKIILDSPKDYPTISMQFYQSVTELKSRLARMFDDTIALQKLEIERELLEIDIQEKVAAANTRREELEIKLLSQELLQKNVRIGFAKESLKTLSDEIEDFKQLCDQYAATGEVKKYQDARMEEMDKKKKMLFLAHVLGNKRELAPSEMAFFLQENGMLKPPVGIEDDLRRLKRPELALLIEEQREIIETAHQLLLENKIPELKELGFIDPIRLHRE